MTTSRLDVVASQGAYFATINRQHPAADGYNAKLPWLLLHGDGRTAKAPTLAAIRAEAKHCYPAATFRRA